MDRIKIGVIGAGNFASWVHYPSLSEIEDCELSAICELEEEKMNNIGLKYNIKNRFTDYKKMIQEMLLDAVYIIMPPHYLKEPVTYCLSKGLNVFIEKPPGISISQLEEWVDLADKNDCKTMVGFNRRFAPLILESRRIVEENGKITVCFAEYYKNFVETKSNPYNKDIAHSILLYDTIHSVDLLRWLGGEVVKVQSMVNSLFHNYQNSFYSLIKFQDSCQGILVNNFAAGNRIERFEIHGKGISVLIEPPYRARVYSAKGEYIVKTSQLTGIEEDMVNSCKLKGESVMHRIYGYLQESQHFIECVKKNKQPLTNFKDALKTMKLVEEIAA